ncbi:MAG: hypothetical protein ABL982_26190, partial [Vicinamibacterales bacterium]
MSGPAAWLVKGSDELLRERALDALVVELIGDDDRSLALEEIAVPGRASDYMQLHFGTSQPLTNVKFLQGGTGNLSYQPTLNPDTTYLWQATCGSVDGGATSGPVWSFRTVGRPSVPHSPAPGDGASGVDVNPTLSWAAPGATSSSPVVDFVPGFETGVTSTGGVWKAVLQYGTCYTWRVNASNAQGSTTGPDWRMCTKAAPPNLVLEDRFAPPFGSSSLSDRRPMFSRALPQYWASAGDGESPRVRTDASLGVPTATGGAGDSMAIVNPGLADHQAHTVTARVRLGAGAARAGVLFRYRDKDNYWLVRPRGNLLEIVRRQSGNSEVVWDWPIPTPLKTTDHTLKVLLTGSLITATWDTIETSYSDPFLGSEPQAGLWWATLDKTDTFQSFEVSVPTAPLAPAAPQGPSPAAAALDITRTPTLTWSSPGSIRWDVALGTTASPPTVVSGLTSPSYSTSALAAGATYYWRVTGTGPGGTTAGPLWSFTTTGGMPGAPASPAPASDATAVPIGTALSWSAVGATSYDVAFGTTNP